MNGIQMHYRLAIASLIAFLLGGCAPFQIHPSVSHGQPFRTPVEKSLQLILPNEFQSLSIIQKPNYGSSLGYRDYEFHLGEPASSAIAASVRSRFANVRIGHRDDGKPADLTVTLSSARIEFGADDGTAMNLLYLTGALGGMADLVVGSRVTLATRVSRPGAAPREIEVVGVGAVKTMLLTVLVLKVEESMGKALDDAAVKLADALETDTMKNQ